jgi:uncharacterized protein
VSTPSSATSNPVIDRRRVIDQALIDEVVSRIVAAFDPEEIILFGSHARGDAHADSDLDLLVVMDTDVTYIERSMMIDEVFGWHVWPMDVFVYTPTEFQGDRQVVGTLASIVAKSGKVLHVRRQ